MLRDRQPTVDPDQVPPASEVNTDTPRNSEADTNFLLARLMQVSRTFRTLEGFRLAQFGLFSGQDDCLLALEPNSSVTTSALARQLIVKSPTVSKMVDRLIEGGMIARHSDPTDRRCALVSLTPKGNEARANVMALRAQAEVEFAKAFGIERAAEIAGALRIMSSAIQQRLSGIR